MKPLAQAVPEAGPAELLARIRSLSTVSDAPGAVSSLLRLIGSTPLVELTQIDNVKPRARIFAKLENLNPGGSVKDRTALGMILRARESGELAAGQTLVEPTAGNTGIGLALVAGRLGHPVLAVMPERYSGEKRRLCCALGGEVACLPGERTGMAECRTEARRLAAECGGLVLDQFRNPGNPEIHELTTGPEILHQVKARIDAAVLGVGTGGTLTGVGRALHRAHPEIEVWAVENQASILGGEAIGQSRIEGIGSTFVPETLDRTLLTGCLRVGDAEAFETARRLAHDEGLLVGGSSGAAVHAALQVARRLGPERSVVTVIADGGERYCSQGLYESRP